MVLKSKKQNRNHLFTVRCDDSDVIKSQRIEAIVDDRLKIFHYKNCLLWVEPWWTAALTHVFSLCQTPHNFILTGNKQQLQTRKPSSEVAPTNSAIGFPPVTMIFHLVTSTYNFDQNSVKVNQQTYRSKVICALTLWVGRQEGHPACKNLSGGCWRGCLSGAYGPADATATHCLLLQ